MPFTLLGPLPAQADRCHTERHTLVAQEDYWDESHVRLLLLPLVVVVG